MKQVSILTWLLIVGAYEGLGYGESVGKMISNEGLHIPEISFLMFEALSR